ncbi:MAG: GNAT family N-acetyltransferase [Pseudomonadota bacterium]
MEPASIVIQQLNEKDFAKFFSYLDQHLSDNGKNGTPLFQPASRSASGYPVERKAGFIQSLAISPGDPKWRRVWVALNTHDEIVGHVDLRAHHEPYTEHRALLGMGVRKDMQRQGLGKKLLEFAFAWAKQFGLIEIIDLSVMADNAPAIQLYRRAGFVRICQINDMFRIDGRSEAHIIMARSVLDRDE